MNVSYGYEKRGVAYDTLYGYAPTKEEFEAQQAERKAKGWFHMSDQDYHTPYHAQWQRHANGGHNIVGEWEFAGSYDCEKIIRPSYDRDMTVRLVVHVGGKFKSKWPKGRSYNRWSASIKCGRYQTSFYDKKFGKSCNSIADACRKAEKLPFLDEEVKKLLKRVFAPLGSEAVFRYNRATFEYEPFMTDLGIAGSPHDWPDGKYFHTKWHKPYHGPDKTKWLMTGSTCKVEHYGYCGGGYDALPGLEYRHDLGNTARKMIHDAVVEATGCWVPKPEEEASYS